MIMDLDHEYGYADGQIVPIETTHEDHALAERVLAEEIDPETLRIAQAIAFETAADLLKPMLQLIISAPNAAFTCDVLASAFGLSIRQGITRVDLARHYGVSKQAIRNAEKNLAAQLGLKIVNRSSQHKTDLYEKRNHRHLPAEWDASNQRDGTLQDSVSAHPTELNGADTARGSAAGEVAITGALVQGGPVGK
jgi:hypothetical protein